MITVKVRLFAMLREIAGKEECEVSGSDDLTVARLFEQFSKTYPRMKEWQSHVRFAVNNVYVGGEHALREADEVALIPPVSGG
jgi:molybdopterin converting factor subunit 1